ncbi:hypothetical protein DICVIV_10560 [Dictyocaulus viviparus]|uniref:CBS domain-containing protein n=1 Tax=Dictyocaulus viviparus TaxID=29172 RepID=A0A0D8XI26_DICVI|nr:hypothetical protein DICVIV_10560 [Dictyocaulus viviparus]
MIAVLVANAVSSHLQPSIYDSIIKIKRLPYLPDISHSSSMYHSLTAAQFMTTPVAFIGKDSTYAEIQELIYKMDYIRAFPLVENKKSMALLGSVSRSQLFKLIQSKVGVKARQMEATQRIRKAINDVSRRYRLSYGPRPYQKFVDGENPVGRGRASTRFTVQSISTDENSLSSKCSSMSQQNILNVQGPLFKTLSETKLTPSKKNRSILDYESNQTFNGSITIGDVFRSITRKSFGIVKKERDTEFDLHGEEREEWEKQTLQEKIDLLQIQIDPSPFQLVRQ